MAMVWLRLPHVFVLLLLVGVFLQAASALDKGRGVYLVPDDHIEGREISGEEDYWALTADLGNPAVQCAQGPITATLVLETFSDITNATFVLSLEGRSANLHVHPSEKVVEIELAPRESQQQCVLKKNATVTVKVYCPECAKLSSTVRYTPGHAIGVAFLPQPLTTGIPLPAATQGSRAMRFSTHVDERLLVNGGGRVFTAFFTFSSLEGTKIENFVARVRTLLVNDEAYYTRLSPMGNEATVYASIKLPQHLDASESSELVIDVECDGCNEKEVFLTYKPERTGIFSIENDAFYHRFFQRQVSEKRLHGTEVTEEKNVKTRSWEFNVNTANLCNSMYQGAVFIVAANPWSKASFYWQSGGVRYEAAVIQSYEQRLVQWVAKNKQNPCSTAGAKISLYMTCEDCNAADTGASCLPLEPQVPQGAYQVRDAMITGSWGKNESCTVSITSNGKKHTVREGDIFQVWVDFPTDSQAFATKASSTVTSKNEETTRDVLTKLEKDLSQNPLRSSWSLSGGSEWLCENLKGRVYRLVEATGATS